MNATHTPDALFSLVTSKLCLAALSGSQKPMAAFKLARDLFDFAPSIYAENVEQIAEDILDPRAICWVIAEELKNLPGAWTLYTQARDIARA